MKLKEKGELWLVEEEVEEAVVGLNSNSIELELVVVIHESMRWVLGMVGGWLAAS